ncbi:MAG: 50S ribosomal protein L4 [Candidatus Omnitrophica bacterium]|nr:50S ribosomal protein L4 [Candidatus Omnitrophota bacterium]
MPKLTVYKIDGKESGSMDLPSEFDKAVNQDVIHQAIVMYQANARQGNADTKIRSEVSGGNKKPFRQKGTGQARQGSTRSPLFKKGGIVFGPHPRDYGYTIPKKVRMGALRESLNAKFKGSSLVCVDDMVMKSGKTKDFLAIMKNLKISGKKTLAIFEGSSKEAMLASRNIRGIQHEKAAEVNALDVLKNNKVLATKAAMEKILKRLQ